MEGNRPFGQELQQCLREDPSAPRPHVVRSLLLSTFQDPSSAPTSLLSSLRLQAPQKSELSSFKALLLLHRLLREAHPSFLNQAFLESSLLDLLSSSSSARRQRLGYEQEIIAYASFLRLRLLFHHLRPEFNGALDFEEFLSSTTTEINEGYEIVGMLLKLLEEALQLAGKVYSNLEASDFPECRVVCLSILIEDTFAIFQLVTILLKALHSAVSDHDALKLLRDQFERLFHSMTKFFSSANSLLSRGHHFSIPQIPQDPLQLILCHEDLHPYHPQHLTPLPHTPPTASPTPFSSLDPLPLPPTPPLPSRRPPLHPLHQRHSSEPLSALPSAPVSSHSLDSLSLAPPSYSSHFSPPSPLSSFPNPIPNHVSLTSPAPLSTSSPSLSASGLIEGLQGENQRLGEVERELRLKNQVLERELRSERARFAELQDRDGRLVTELQKECHELKTLLTRQQELHAIECQRHLAEIEKMRTLVQEKEKEQEKERQREKEKEKERQKEKERNKDEGREIESKHEAPREVERKEGSKGPDVTPEEQRRRAFALKLQTRPPPPPTAKPPPISSLSSTSSSSQPSTSSSVPFLPSPSSSAPTVSRAHPSSSSKHSTDPFPAIRIIPPLPTLGSKSLPHQEAPSSSPFARPSDSLRHWPFSLERLLSEEIPSPKQPYQASLEQLITVVQSKEALLSPQPSLPPEEIKKALLKIDQELRELATTQFAQVSYFGQEMQKIRAALQGTSDTKATLDLEERMATLEAKRIRLLEEGEKRERLCWELKEILGRPSSLAFLLAVQVKLTQVILGGKLSACLAPKAASPSPPFPSLLLAREPLPLPASSRELSSIGKPTRSLQPDHVVGKEMLLASLKEIDLVAGLVARKLAGIYREQLALLSPENAWLLGECAVKEILALLWKWEEEEEEEEPRGKVEMLRGGGASGMTLEEVAGRLSSAVACLESEEEGKMRGIKLMETLNRRHCSGRGVIFPLLTHPPAFDLAIVNHLVKEAGEGWTADAIFHRPGIVTFDGEKRLWFSGKTTRPDSYGYRVGSQEEALEGGLLQTRERLPSVVPEAEEGIAFRQINK